MWGDATFVNFGGLWDANREPVHLWWIINGTLSDSVRRNARRVAAAAADDAWSRLSGQWWRLQVMAVRDPDSSIGSRQRTTKLILGGNSVRAQKAFALDYCASAFVTEGAYSTFPEQCRLMGA